jgi:porin
LSGSAGLVRLKHHVHQFGDDCVGAAQVYSNIDAAQRTTLYEAWIEQRLLSEKIRVKAGKIDANTEFAVVQNGSDFLNSSMGYSPTIVAFPTYPEPKLGVNAFLHPTPNYGLGLGVFQTAGMGTLSIIEPGRSWSLGNGEQPGRVSAGYWRLDGQVSRFDGSGSSSTQGFYSVMEQLVWRQAGQRDQGERRLSAFLQLGRADGQVSAFTRHVGAGTVLQGPLRKRSQDAIGVAVTWVRFSSQPAAGFDLRSEMVLESYYKATLTKHIALVQDFQFVHHPGGLHANRDCPVVTPRLVISF